MPHTHANYKENGWDINALNVSLYGCLNGNAVEEITEYNAHPIILIIKIVYQIHYETYNTLLL